MESYLNFGRNDPNYGFSFRGIKKGNNRQLYYVVTFEILRDLPVIVGGLSGMLFEKTDKVLGIFKSESAADLTDRQQFIAEIFLGGSQQTIVDEILGGPSGFSLDQLAEVTGCQAAFVCEITDTGQSFFFCLVTKIIF